MDIYSVYHIQDKPEVGPYVGCSKNLKRRAGEHGVSLKDLEILFQSEDIIEASLMEKEEWIRLTGREWTGKFYHLMCSEEQNQSVRIARIGVSHSPETCQKISDTKRGVPIGPPSPEHRKALSEFRRGRVYINNGIINKQIQPEQLLTYLDDGWKIGMKPNQAIGDVRRGMIWVTNGVINKVVIPEQLLTYLDNGWQRGKITKTYRKLKQKTIQ